MGIVRAKGERMPVDQDELGGMGGRNGGHNSLQASQNRDVSLTPYDRNYRSREWMLTKLGWKSGQIFQGMIFNE
jgi:hypothetical protein